MKSYHQFIYPNVILTENSVSYNGKAISYQIETGWRLGKGLISKDKKQFWIEIPKNASNSMSEFLYYDRDWKEANYYKIKHDINYHVILRDPMDRWKKCIVEICNIQKEEKLKGRFDYWFVRQKFTNVYEYYDLHIVRQSDFLINTPWDRTSFYHMHDRLSETILKNFNDEGPFPALNITKLNKKKMRILDMVENLMNSEVENRLREFYALDYELISKVKFVSFDNAMNMINI